MSDTRLSEEARLARNAYYRQYRAKNKDRIKTINARYWAKYAERRRVKRAQIERNGS